MNAKEFYRELGNIDDDLIVSAGETPARRKKPVFIYTAVASAACLCLLIGGISLGISSGNNNPAVSGEDTRQSVTTEEPTFKKTGDTSEEQASDTSAEKTVISGENEELAALKGWWTREGIFYDGINLVRISFRSADSGCEENTWFVNGVFGDNRFFSGAVELTEDGLEGTVKTGTADENFFSEESRGIAEVKISEEGEYSILLVFGTDEEYHLTLLTELEP